MRKKLLFILGTIAAFLITAPFALAAPVSWDGDFTNQILQPLSTYVSAVIKGHHFVATSTVASVFPNASTTNLSVSSLIPGNCVQAATGGLLTTTGLACGSGGSNYFTNSGIYTYLSTGINLGIGTATPPARLSIDNGYNDLTPYLQFNSASSTIGTTTNLLVTPAYTEFRYPDNGPTVNSGFMVNYNAAEPALVPHGDDIQINGADNNHAALYIDSHGGLWSTINLRTANGTGAAPTATTIGNELGRIAGRGYGSTDWTGSTAALSFRAAENFSSTSQGTYAVLSTTALGTTGGGSFLLPVERLRVQPSGGVSIGSSTFNGTDPGLGILNIMNGLNVGTSTAAGFPLTVVGNENHIGGYFHFGTSTPLAQCNTVMGASTCMEFVGSDNSIGGTGLYVDNINPGTSAYGGITLLNSNVANATTNYAGLFLNSPSYSDTSFGTSEAIPNLLQLGNSMGPISIQSFGSTTASSYINFYASATLPGSGLSSSMEGMRLTSTGLGIGSTSPSATLTVNGTANINGLTGIGLVPAANVGLNAGTTTASDSFIGENITVAAASGTSTAVVQGLNSAPSWGPLSTVNNTVTTLGGGVRNRYQARNNSLGFNVAVASAVSGQVIVNGTAASTTDGAAFNAENPAVSGGNLLTNSYGLWVRGLAVAGTITNHYGVFIDPLTSGTNRWGIYQNGPSDPNYFAGKTGFGTTTPAFPVVVIGTTTASCFSNDNGATCITGSGGSGTVTSVGLSVPTGLSVSGSPVTTSGTLALTLTAGYNIPLTASTTNWESAYQNRITSATLPLSISSNTISIAQANTSTSGYLSNTDWNTFNNKQAALVGTTGQLGYFSATNTFTATSSIFLASNGNFGIGSTSPAARLTVSGGNILLDNNFALTEANTAGTAINLIGLNSSNNITVGAGTTGVGILSLLSGTNSNINLIAGGVTSLTAVPVTGNIGIGTTTPGEKLTIAGSGATRLTISDSSSTGIGRLVASANDVFVQNASAAGNLYLGAANLSTIAITPAGNVGIGTTTPSSKFDVAVTPSTVQANTSGTLLEGNAGAGQGYIGNVLTMYNSTAQVTADFRLARTGGNAFLGAELGTETNNDLRFFTNGNTNERIRITAAGNVGIATSTPGRTLTVAGDIGLTGALYAGNTSAGTNGQILQTTGTGVQWVSTSTLGFPAAFSTTATGLTYTAGTGVLSFTAGYNIPLTASTTDWQTAFSNRITSLTNIGTGVATLSANVLNIPLYAATTTSNTWSGTQTFTNAPTFSSMTLGSVLFAGTSGALTQDNANFFWDDTNNRLGLGSSTPTSLLSINSAGNPTSTPLFTIASSTTNVFSITASTLPKLAVGTTTPPWTLSVTGTMGVDGLTTSASFQQAIICLSASKEFIAESVACVASAKRYKENIEPLNVGLDELMKLRPVAFTWKKDYLGGNVNDPNQNGVQYSLIADDVQNIDPKLVSITTEETTFEGKTYPAGTVNGLADMNHWVALIVKSIQDLVAKNDTANNAQDAKIAELQAEVDELKAGTTTPAVMMCSL